MAKITDTGVEENDEVLNVGAETTALTTPGTYVAIEGDVDASDLRMPTMKAWSASCQEFLNDRIGDQGDILFRGFVVGNSANPVEMIILKIKKYFKENLPFGSDERPQIFDTVQDYQNAGFDKKDIIRCADVIFLAKRPEKTCSASTTEDDLDMLFGIDFMDGKWAAGKMILQKTNYSTAVVPLLTFASIANPKNGFLEHRVRLGSDIQTSGKNKYTNLKASVQSKKVEGQLDALVASELLSLAQG